MTGDREAFEAAIVRDPYDGDLRKVFSDWLEEHGYDDEAVWQRSWTPERQHAIEWLTEYAQELCDDDPEAEWNTGFTMTYEDLIEAANDYLDSGEVTCLPYDTPDVVYERSGEFWERFTLATGRPVSDDHQGMSFFRCAC